MNRADRWKYLVATVKTGFGGRVPAERLQEELERHGSQGWELVQILRTKPSWGSAQLIFKRPA